MDPSLETNIDGVNIREACALAIQGRAYRAEPVTPEPFTSPLNAVVSILLEQWLTFPRFVLCGGWSRALRERCCNF